MQIIGVSIPRHSLELNRGDFSNRLIVKIKDGSINTVLIICIRFNYRNFETAMNGRLETSSTPAPNLAALQTLVIIIVDCR